MTKKKTSNEDRLYITGVEVENFKRINLVKIIPNEKGLTIIGGDNAQGKSSLLDATMAALAGTKSAPDDPIHHGADKSLTTVDLSNGLQVRRSFTEKGGGLIVETAEGHRVTSPQKALDDPFGGIGFDPVRFTRTETPAEERAQMEQLQAALGIDFSKLDTDKVNTFDARSVVNREAKRLTGVVDSAEHYPDAPDEEILIGDLLVDLEVAKKHNDAIEADEKKINELAIEADKLAASIARLKKDLVDTRAKITIRKKALESAERIDTDKISLRIRNAEKDNSFARANQKRAEAVAELKAKEAESEKLSGKLIKIAAEKRAIIEAADIPVKGLDFGESGLAYLGVPLSQASSAEKITVAIALADVLSPKSKVVLIREGSNLDPKTLLLVATLATDRGLQVFMERVSKGDEVDFIIEDGKVKEGD